MKPETKSRTAKPKQTTTVGRIVHYTLPDGPSEGKTRPAIIVEVHDPECVNLQVFMDGRNDSEHGVKQATAWRTSVMYSESPKPGTWCWPPRVG